MAAFAGSGFSTSAFSAGSFDFGSVVPPIPVPDAGSTPGFNWSRIPRPRMRNRRDEFTPPQIETVVQSAPIECDSPGTEYLGKIEADIVRLREEVNGYHKKLDAVAEHSAAMEYIKECDGIIRGLEQEKARIARDIEESDMVFIVSVLAHM